MEEITIKKFTNSLQVKAFCSITNSFKTDVDVLFANSAYDGKSYLGMLNLVGSDLAETATVRLLSDDKDEQQEFLKVLEMFT